MSDVKVCPASIDTDVLVIDWMCARAVIESIAELIDGFGEGVVRVELQSVPRAISQDELATVIDRLERVGAEVIAAKVWIRSA